MAMETPKCSICDEAGWISVNAPQDGNQDYEGVKMRSIGGELVCEWCEEESTQYAAEARHQADALFDKR